MSRWINQVIFDYLDLFYVNLFTGKEKRSD